MSGPSGSARASADNGWSADLSNGFASGFRLGAGSHANLHPHPDSSKFPSLTLQGSQQFGASLPHDRSDGAGVGGKFQLPVSFFRDANAEGQRARQMPAHDSREHFLAIATGGPFGQRRVGAKDALKRLRGTHHGGKGARLRTGGAPRRKSWEEPQLNIILVSGATARVRSLTLDWRHWTLGGLALAVVFIAFTGVFNFVTLRYAASIQHPWLQAIVLADQREEAQKTQELVHGHLNAMALRLGRIAGADDAARRIGRAAGENRRA